MKDVVVRFVGVEYLLEKVRLAFDSLMQVVGNFLQRRDT